MRTFNTEGPVVIADHYNIPPLDRMDLGYLLELIRAKKYFVLHAPRQTGKTSILLALRDLINSGSAGPFRCLYVNLEAAQAAQEDVGEAMRSILNEIASRARSTLKDDFFRRVWPDVLKMAGPFGALNDALVEWSEESTRPLVLFVDEIDALVGDTLLAVLRQIRSGYDRRPKSFPQSIVLCGVRDLRDYRIHSPSGGEPVTGGSVFNISADSLRLGDFSESEVEALLEQHTAETGQPFHPQALQRVWEQTRGQPWLVNALCQRACFRNPSGRDRGRPIMEADILDAREQLILKRVVHLDQLADKLREDRVRQLIEPMLSGEDHHEEPSTSLERLRDLEYARDIGLLARDDPPRVANPIYAEVVPRELIAAVQGDLPLQPAWYINPDRGLKLGELLAGFQDFFRQHSEQWLKRFDYQAAGPQLLLQAYLQRVLNSGGHVDREYGAGRGRIDLFVRWPHTTGEQRFVIECKIVRDGLDSTIRKGLLQTHGYMDRCGAQEGHLVLFDPADRPWMDKIFRKTEPVDDRTIEVWGM